MKNGRYSAEQNIVPIVSVIVPVYNTSSYLSQCIDSILKQSFKAFELLLIDDGSSDISPEICDQYAQKDARVHVAHKANGGVSSARNLGIELSVGKYIVFIDSDDYIDDDYLSDMMNHVQEQFDNREKELLVFDYQPFSEAGFSERKYPIAFSADLTLGGMTIEEFKEFVFDFRIFPPYCKLYCSDIIKKNKIYFDTELRSAEDFHFNSKYIEKIDRIRYIPHIHYFYRVDYKKYIPSNDGVLGRSEIKSVHIMSHGITDLAKRLGLYAELKKEISLWAAEKHYFNRMPMLFKKNKNITMTQRYELYHQLIGDSLYYELYKYGAPSMVKSMTRFLGCKLDYFFVWYLFYRIHKN